MGAPPALCGPNPAPRVRGAAPSTLDRNVQDPQPGVHVADHDVPGRLVPGHAPILGRVGEDEPLARLHWILARRHDEEGDLARRGGIAYVDNPDPVRVPGGVDPAPNKQRVVDGEIASSWVRGPGRVRRAELPDLDGVRRDPSSRRPGGSRTPSPPRSPVSRSILDGPPSRPESGGRSLGCPR